ncbi:MAG: DUF192 domain-containing protein [Aquabacterium sp.]
MPIAPEQTLIVVHAAAQALMRGLVRLGSSVGLAVLCSGPALAQPPAAGQPQSLPTIQLSAGMYNIRAEVARTPQEQAIGLMHRRSMPVNHGMLFVFDQRGQQCFWMKNTLMPLSIAFLADDGRVVNMAEMKAGSVDQHCSTEPVRYALEMNQGWFTKRSVKVGDRIKGGPFGPLSATSAR